MAKVHVFNAGPCLLPQPVTTMNECRSLWKELLNIPDTHEVVFLGGGASLEFLYVAMNFLEKKAAYLDTGVWAHKALKEAQGIGEAYALACSKDKNYSYRRLQVRPHLWRRPEERRPCGRHLRHHPQGRPGQGLTLSPYHA